MFNDSPLPYWSRRFPPSLHPRLRLLLFFLSVGILKKSGSTTSRKLASHGFGASMAAMSSFPPQRYHYFLVLDFEATCDKPQLHPQVTSQSFILPLQAAASTLGKKCLSLSPQRALRSISSFPVLCIPLSCSSSCRLRWSLRGNPEGVSASWSLCWKCEQNPAPWPPPRQ